MSNHKCIKMITYAIKIAVGSFVAIYIAEFLNLENAASAGSITLLTIVTTKWDTMKLSMFRIVSFGISVTVSEILFLKFSFDWMAYGLFIFIIVLVCCYFEWKETISVNAVIGTHFLLKQSFDTSFIMNEFLLVLIGITIAIILNLFQGNGYQKKRIIGSIKEVEKALQFIMGELAAYLMHSDMQINVWDNIIELESELKKYTEAAYEYQSNTFRSHPQYYIDYFEMRGKQCNILHNLHYELKKMRSVPEQAVIVAEYLIYLLDFIREDNIPLEQLQELEAIFEKMKKEPLPMTRQEFESRSILYHILMDLEEFLIVKKRFVESQSEKQRNRYWKINNA